jgi:hypothetical protein
VFHVRSRNKTSECNFVESKENESSKNENAKIAEENNVGCIFVAKGIIYHEFVPKKQIVNDGFIKW